MLRNEVREKVEERDALRPPLRGARQRIHVARDDRQESRKGPRNLREPTRYGVKLNNFKKEHNAYDDGAIALCEVNGQSIEIGMDAESVGNDSDDACDGDKRVEKESTGCHRRDIALHGESGWHRRRRTVARR